MVPTAVAQEVEELLRREVDRGLDIDIGPGRKGQGHLEAREVEGLLRRAVDPGVGIGHIREAPEEVVLVGIQTKDQLPLHAGLARSKLIRCILK